MPLWIPALLVSLAVAAFTLAVVLVLMRRQRAKLEKIVSDFASQNVTMARRLTEIMLNQQKKQEQHEEALEKIASHAMMMRKELNLLAIQSLEEDEDPMAPKDPETKRLH